MCPAENPASPPQPEAEPVVLIVEDEIILRLAVAAHLRDCGFAVIEAGNGAEAQSLLLAGLKPDLIFSDISMPGVDGVALARWLGETGVDAPIVMTSGLVTALDAAKATCSNISEFVVKPYDPDKLAEQFRALVAARS